MHTGSGALIAVQITGPGFLGVAADHSAAATPRAHLMMQVAPRDVADVEARLARMDALTALHQITGEYDMVAVVEASGLDELERVVEAIRALSGVRRAQVSMLLSQKPYERNARPNASE